MKNIIKIATAALALSLAVAAPASAAWNSAASGNGAIHQTASGGPSGGSATN